MSPDSEKQFPDNPADASDARWLDVVMRETLGGSSGGPGYDAGLSALLDLRKRRAGEPFQLTPVGEEMVSAVLSANYGAPPSGEMATQIAESLVSDESAGRRLEALWDRLATAAGGM